MIRGLLREPMQRAGLQKPARSHSNLHRTYADAI